jgi:hypothetical protein
MKVLIDACAPKALKIALAVSGFDCTTVQEAGLLAHISESGGSGACRLENNVCNT